jgi:peptide/nickel transport system substrate-binding protein
LFNYAFGDDSIRGMINDYRFRKAISLGINRQEIIDVLYLGFGTIPERIPAEFNAKEANDLLDEMGMAVGANGFRNSPEGKPFKFMVESDGAAIDLSPASEIVAAHMRENLKIDAEMRLNDSTVQGQLNTDNLIMSGIFWTFDQMADSEYTHRWQTVSPYTRNYMNAKVAGKPTDADNMAEPAEWIQKGYEIYSRFINAVYGSPEYKSINEEAARYYYDNIPGVPLIENSVLPIPISGKFGNVPTGGYQICVLMTAETLFIK